VVSLEYLEPAGDSASAPETWTYTRSPALTPLELCGKFLLDDPLMVTALSDRIMKVLAADDEECNAIRKMPEEAEKSQAA